MCEGAAQFLPGVFLSRSQEASPTGVSDMTQFPVLKNGVNALLTLEESVQGTRPGIARRTPIQETNTQTAGSRS